MKAITYKNIEILRNEFVELAIKFNSEIPIDNLYFNRTPDEIRYKQLFQFFHPNYQNNRFINPLDQIVQEDILQEIY